MNSVPSSAPTKPIVLPVQRSFSNAGQHLNKQKSFDIDISMRIFSLSFFFSIYQGFHDVLCVGVGGGYSLGYENRSSCSRSKPIIMSSSLNQGSNNQVTRSQSFAQQRSPAAAAGLHSSPSATTDNEEEDSMHEKYFSPNVLSMQKKAIESTPLVCY